MSESQLAGGAQKDIIIGTVGMWCSFRFDFGCGGRATQTVTPAENGFGITVKNTSSACAPAWIKAKNNCIRGHMRKEAAFQRDDNKSKKNSWNRVAAGDVLV